MESGHYDLVTPERERRPPDIVLASMDVHYIDRMRGRLANMRKVASMAHDRRIIELVTATADELEEDIRKLEAEGSSPVTIHLTPRLER
jgi:hypothetical protein